MSRVLVGHKRTRVRRAVAPPAGSDPAEVARKLGMKRHTIAAILNERLRPGERFARAVARATG